MANRLTGRGENRLRRALSAGAGLSLVPVVALVLVGCTVAANASDSSSSTEPSSSGTSTQPSTMPTTSAGSNAAAGQSTSTPIPESPNTSVPGSTCVPTQIDSGAPATAGWGATPTGWTISWAAADAPDLGQYFSTTTMYPLPGIATMTVIDNGVSRTIAPTIGVWSSADGRADIWEISPSGGTLVVTKAQLDAAVRSALPAVTTYQVTALSVEVRDVHMTGCGATAIASLTVGGAISAP